MPPATPLPVPPTDRDDTREPHDGQNLVPAPIGVSQRAQYAADRR